MEVFHHKDEIDETQLGVGDAVVDSDVSGPSPPLEDTDERV